MKAEVQFEFYFTYVCKVSLYRAEIRVKFNCYLFTAKGGITTKLWPNRRLLMKIFFSLNLNLGKNPPLTVIK